MTPVLFQVLPALVSLLNLEVLGQQRTGQGIWKTILTGFTPALSLNLLSWCPRM